MFHSLALMYVLIISMSLCRKLQVFQDMATRILAGWYLFCVHDCFLILIFFREGIYWDRTLATHPSISIQTIWVIPSTRYVAAGHFFCIVRPITLTRCLGLPACQCPRRSCHVSVRSSFLSINCPKPSFDNQYYQDHWCRVYRPP